MPNDFNDLETRYFEVFYFWTRVENGEESEERSGSEVYAVNIHKDSDFNVRDWFNENSEKETWVKRTFNTYEELSYEQYLNKQ